jgi:polysaccharide biosynthesis protein PslH
VRNIGNKMRELTSLPPCRIVLVSTMMPLPFGHPPGGRWTYVLFKGLVERGHRVTMFVPCYRREQQDAARDLFPAPAFDLRTYLIQAPAKSTLRTKWRTLRQPYSYMFGDDLRGDLQRTLSDSWDILHMEDIWSGWLGLPYDRRRAVLNFHNLFRIDDADSAYPGWREAWMRRLRRRGEARLARSFPNLMALTERLASELALLAQRSCVTVVPLGMDLNLYPFIPLERRTRSLVVSVIGSMNWQPSYSAAVRLLTRLWPAIKAQVPEARCRVVGWQAREALRKYLGMPDIDVVENVPDILPYFESTSVLLYAPTRGSGMKVKVLEAFAIGVPVVTTSEGIEGIPAIDGVHAGVCEDDAGLVERTVQLLKERGRQERQRIAARVLLEAHCSPQATVSRVEQLYATMPNVRAQIGAACLKRDRETLAGAAS